MMKIRLEQQDEQNPLVWYFQLYGPDTVDATVRLVVVTRTLGAGETPADWLAANQAEAQTLVDGGIKNAFTVREEARLFIDAHPNAKQLITLGPTALEAAITNRTAGQETLLLLTYAYAIRVDYAED